ncbi:MAG: NTP transferase domain-containing protein [Nitrospinae bacterium]|nr:NTP transferase domain-containing protein [Nitrospinota bacterium]
MKTIILASGESKEMTPFGEVPKPILHIGNRYLLAHYLKWLKEIALNNINLIVQENNDRIQQVFANGEDYSCKINYFVQTEKNKGIGKAINLAKERINQGEHFLLIYGDTIFNSNVFLNALETFSATKEATAVITHSKSPESYGNVYLSGDMCINKIIEKPEAGQWGNYVLAGVFILPYSFFDSLEKSNFSMESALKDFMTNNKLKGCIWEEEWIDIVYPWDLLNANRIIMSKWNGIHIDKTAKISRSVHIDGSVYIDSGAEIKGGTIIRGPAYIGKNCYIGNNALIRKHSSLGSGTLVGYGVEIKNCLLFEKAQIGRLSFIGDSVIGENVDIGSGVMTVNRQENFENISVKLGKETVNTELTKLGICVGNNSIIGGNHTFRPGTIIEADAEIPTNYTYPSP